MFIQSLKPVLKRALVVLCIAHTAHTPLWGWHHPKRKLHQQKMSKAERKNRAKLRKYQKVRAEQEIRDSDKAIRRIQQRTLANQRQEATMRQNQQLAAQKRARMLHKKPA